MKTKLHLGCGHYIKEGWINHDLASLPGVDMVHDLRVFPWPWDDGKGVSPCLLTSRKNLIGKPEKISL